MQLIPQKIKKLKSKDNSPFLGKFVNKSRCRVRSRRRSRRHPASDFLVPRRIIFQINMAAIPVNFVILISLIATFLYLLGVHNFVTRVEENACEMTYMFEYPQYVVSCKKSLCVYHVIQI